MRPRSVIVTFELSDTAWPLSEIRNFIKDMFSGAQRDDRGIASQVETNVVDATKGKKKAGKRR